jgi:type IV fimbrial biogenesis protein FimT
MIAPTKSGKNCAGFTLVELLITITVAAVLLAIAVPSFQTTLVRSRLATQANDLIAGINLARSEAIKGNRTTFFCRTTSDTATACANAAGNWTFWIVRDSTTVLRRGVVKTYGGTLTVTSTLASDMATFSGDGLRYSGSSSGGLIANGLITVKASNVSSENLRCIRLGAGSRNLTQTATGACP